MPRPAFWLQVQTFLALGYGVISSPILDDSSQKVFPHEKLQSRKLHGRFLHITGLFPLHPLRANIAFLGHQHLLTRHSDLHPDEFYKPHTSTEDGIACHRGRGMAGTYGAEKTDCDSPFSLVDATLQWIQENIKNDIDFVIWTGDSARHDSDEAHPRTNKAVLDSNKLVTDKIIKTFSSSKGKLDVPIIPTFGNNDFLPHNIMYPGPNQWFAAYGEIWNRFIPEEQRHSFQFGGWFHVDVIPGKLTVFSLNTMYFFDRNAAVDGCALPSEPGYKHMEWLRVQLDLVRRTGAKAILMGHVPPARTNSKQNWDESCWQRYTLWLQKYRDVVVASLFGHMNIDHFLLSDTKNIDLNVATDTASTARSVKRDSIDESDFSVLGKDGYLQELRDIWGDIPGSATKVFDEEESLSEVDTEKRKKKKHRKKKEGFKKIGGKYAERYQLSFISPSVVPNYFPTIRVFEYNVTGLENVAVWEDKRAIENAQSTENLELRSVGIGKRGKGKQKPKDPNLIIPDDPPKAALPGPAYYPQQFTLTGYTQYYANLTHINNDETGLDEVEGSKWRDGNHGDKKPTRKPAQPRKFQFEVEYSTFDEKRFRLKDLTVRSYLHLAYRMSQRSKKNNGITEEEDGVGDIGVDKKKNKKKRKKKHKNKETNKTWLRWLNFAFVSAIPEEDLEQI
ncbi:Endopolyphosphatase [Metarhizium album ARSEF 1941]|uniref:Endopolyphosphatase n=1 Tax=Metarhizium album (strain ARSEF 1941) TaxID=1081103 RepID=A0A0B2WPG0_METAS|nr:Endopolyphosphatase [Metarhizium album ARSEF 1941]KHN95357.1 Endopolyphosphatase [Metarhizium album ARSEF 1941]